MKMTLKNRLRFGIFGVLAVLMPAGVWGQVYSTLGDTYISQTNPANNFGNIGTMTVGPLGSPGLGNAALVQVDISTIWESTHRKFNRQHSRFMYIRWGRRADWTWATLTTPWSEGTVTYNTAPVASGAVHIECPRSVGATAM